MGKDSKWKSPDSNCLSPKGIDNGLADLLLLDATASVILAPNQSQPVRRTFGGRLMRSLGMGLLAAVVTLGPTEDTPRRQYEALVEESMNSKS
jgi:hypothetical protein